jgi:hypothetical protein
MAVLSKEFSWSWRRFSNGGEERQRKGGRDGGRTIGTAGSLNFDRPDDSRSSSTNDFIRCESSNSSYSCRSTFDFDECFNLET